MNTEWELCDDRGKYSNTQERLAWDEFYRRGVPDDDVQSFSFSVINPSSGMVVNGMFKRKQTDDIKELAPTTTTTNTGWEIHNGASYNADVARAAWDEFEKFGLIPRFTNSLNFTVDVNGKRSNVRFKRFSIVQPPFPLGLPNINDLEDADSVLYDALTQTFVRPPVRVTCDGANTTQKYHLKDAQKFCDEQRSLAEDFMSSLTIDKEQTKVVAFVLYDVLYIFIRSDVAPRAVVSFSSKSMLHVFYCESKTFGWFDCVVEDLEQSINVQPHLDTKTIRDYGDEYVFTRVPLTEVTETEPIYTQTMDMGTYKLRKPDELLIRILEDTENKTNVALLLGKPGTGKTFFTSCYAARNRAEYIYTLCHDGTNSEDLFYSVNVGKAVLREADNHEEVYQAGILLRAVQASRKGKVVVCIDEIDKASKRTENLLLDFAENYRVPFLDRQEVGVAKNITLFFTSNGYRPHSEAFLRRCYRHHFDFLPRDVEISLIAHKQASIIVDALIAIRAGGASSPSVKEGMQFAASLEHAQSIKDVETLMFAYLCKEPEDYEILSKANYATKFYISNNSSTRMPF